MAELERLESRLADLAGAVEWAPTPRLEGRVRAVVSAPAQRPRWRWALALAAAILVALVGAGLLISPVRDTVAGWLGLRHVGIQRVERLPSPPPSPGSFGAAVSLAEASRLAGFTVLVPTALGTPSEIDFDSRVAAVTLVYPAALVTEVKGTFQTAFVQKMVGPDTSVQQTAVRGQPGVWLEGSPHAIFYQTSTGQVVDATLRLATNTLVWEERGVIFRIESKVSLQRALEVAGTLR